MNPVAASNALFKGLECRHPAKAKQPSILPSTDRRKSLLFSHFCSAVVAIKHAFVTSLAHFSLKNE